MLHRLVIPPRLVLRALDDLHVLASELPALRSAAEEIPRAEDQLSERVDRLNGKVDRLFELIEPLHTELVDVDDTAENLEESLRQLRGEVAPLLPEMREIRGQIRGFYARSAICATGFRGSRSGGRSQPRRPRGGGALAFGLIGHRLAAHQVESLRPNRRRDVRGKGGTPLRP